MTADSRARVLASKDGCNSRVQQMAAPHQGTAWADDSSAKGPPKCSIVIDKELQVLAVAAAPPPPPNRHSRRKSKSSSNSPPAPLALPMVPPMVASMVPSAMPQEAERASRPKPSLLEWKEDYLGLLEDFCFDNKSCLDNSTAKPLQLGRRIRKTSDEFQMWPPQSLSPTSPSSSVSAASPTWPPPASSSSSASSTSGEPAQLYGLASALNQMDMFRKLRPLNASFV